MATVPVKNLKPNEVAELACTYAALILHDEDIDISGTPHSNPRRQTLQARQRCRRQHLSILAQALRKGSRGKEHR